MRGRVMQIMGSEMWSVVEWAFCWIYLCSDHFQGSDMCRKQLQSQAGVFKKGCDWEIVTPVTADFRWVQNKLHRSTAHALVVFILVYISCSRVNYMAETVFVSLRCEAVMWTEKWRLHWIFIWLNMTVAQCWADFHVFSAAEHEDILILSSQ